MNSPSNFNQLIQEGISGLQQGNFEIALHSFSQALQEAPNSVCAYANRAATHYAQGSYDNALNDLSRALELAPDLFSLYLNRGMVYRKLGEVDQAASDFGRAMLLDPKQFYNCVDRVIVLPSDQYSQPHGSTPSSSSSSVQMNSAKPSSVNYQLTMISRPKFNKSIFGLFEAVNQLCTNLELEIDDVLYRKVQQEILKSAIRFYDHIIAKTPYNYLFYWDRSCLFFDVQEYQGAIHDLNITIQYSPQNALLWLNRAIVHYKVLNLSQALADINQAITLNPAFADAYVNRAIILLALQRFDEAKTDLDRAIQIAPENSILRNLRNSLFH